MPDLIGRSLGRYHILEQLGEGGMATVYKAYDTRLERDAAVKVIRRDAFPVNQHELILKRFEREAKALARLAHSNIVSVIDYGEEDGTPYLVMEYLPAGTLKQRLGRPIHWQESVRLLLPVARALQYAHSQKIVHRDVKPSNILITFSGDPMLTDFGIAKILESAEGQTLTGTGVGVGTPEYMAPEQWTGQSGPTSDIYSLGVVLYEMVTGRKPYVADTPAAVLMKQITDPLPRPSQFVPDLPEGVEKLLLKALAKDPEDRYQDMGSVVAAMESLLAGAGAESQPLPVERTIAQPTTAEKPMPQPPPVREPAPPTVKESPTAVATETVPREKPAREDTVLSRPPARRIKFLPFGIGSAALLVIAGAIIGINYLIKNKPVTNAPSSTITPTRTFHPLSTTTNTSIPSATSTPAPKTGDTWQRPSDGMVMVYVPEGEFTMGSDNGGSDEKPVHFVYLDAFWMDQTEVTNKMYALCVVAGKCRTPLYPNSNTRTNYYGNSEYDDFPVVYASWDNASAYCAWAGGGEYDVRLPTEAEWEKTAGWDADKQEKRAYPWGNTIDCTYANYWGKDNGCVGDTTRTGNYPSGASFYGALDMAGNAWEWVADWYSDSYYSTVQDGIRNPTGPSSGTYRVLRGGSWNYDNNFARSANRDKNEPWYFFNNIGFRCSRRAVVPSSTITPAETQLPTATFTPAPEAGATWLRPADGMVMVYVPEGVFTMGSNVGNDDEKPVHTVTLDAFWIDQTEVTNKMYALCVVAGKCGLPISNSSNHHVDYYSNSDYGDFPVINVTWNDAVSYCAWAGGQLPTEAEWEKAARGTDGRTYPWGEGISCQKANYYGCSIGDPTRVRSYEVGKSPYGMYDMSGNAREWAADWYSSSYYSTFVDGIRNPTGPSSGECKVLRGGGWDGPIGPSASRSCFDPTTSNIGIGFRCSRSAAGK